MRWMTVLMLVLIMTGMGVAPASAGDLFSYDGWMRWGYTVGTDWGSTEVAGHDFFWTRFNGYGDLTPQISYAFRLQGIRLENPLGDPFQFGPSWYYLSFKTPFGRVDIGRMAVTPSQNEEMIYELNGMYGNGLAFYPALPEGFSGCLATAYDREIYLDGSHRAFTALLDYTKGPWSVGLNYFDHTRTGEVEHPMISMEIAYRIQPALSLNLELGRNIVYLPEDPTTDPSYVDDIALVALRYADSHWIVFAGYNIPVREYAADVFYFFTPNWAIRTEYNNSFANYSPLFQVSLYFVFASPQPQEGEG